MKLIDMARSPSEQKDSVMPSLGNMPIYDYGLSLCFNDETLQKLNLDSDVEVGDMLDMRCFAKVTSVSKNDTGDGEKCRVEMVLTMIGVENENTEVD